MICGKGKKKMGRAKSEEQRAKREERQGDWEMKRIERIELESVFK